MRDLRREKMNRPKRKKSLKQNKEKLRENPKSRKTKKFKYIISYIMVFENESKSESCSQLNES